MVYICCYQCIWVATFGQLVTLISAFTGHVASTTLGSRDAKL